MALEFAEEDLRIWEFIEKWKKEEELKGPVPEDRIDECAGKVKEMSSGGGEGGEEGEGEEGEGEEEEGEEGEEGVEKEPKEEEEKEKLPPVDEERVKKILKYGLYAGDRNDVLERHGDGRALYPNGDEYTGSFVAGKKNGRGKYIFHLEVLPEEAEGEEEEEPEEEEEGEEGEVKKPKKKKLPKQKVSRPDGKDEVVWKLLTNPSEEEKKEMEELKSEEEKFVYIARVASVPITRVRATFDLGTPYPCYDGEFVDDKFHGHGILRSADGSVYDGEWEKGRPHGEGTFTYSNGDTYTGSFRQGYKHGEANAYGFHDKTSQLHGGWDDGQFTKGTWSMCDGSAYDGVYDAANRPTGNGTFLLKIGDEEYIYEGKFEGGKWVAGELKKRE